MKLRAGKRVTLIPDYSGLPESTKELWREWIWALRIGGFRQTDGFLQSNDGFCAFGVVTDINKERLKGEWRLSERTFGHVRFYIFRMEGQTILQEVSGSLPLALSEKLGFTKTQLMGFTLRLEGIHKGVTIGNINDNFRASFQEIAMILELALNGGYDVECKTGAVSGPIPGRAGK
jgi:hypothetical protein